MANTIALAKNYLDIIDEVYKSASVTADLTSDPSMMRAGANVSEILYPQIEVGGLSRNLKRKNSRNTVFMRLSGFS